MITDLVTRTGLDRTREGLPDPEQIGALAAAGHGLSSPELAVLLAHVKLDLKAAVLRTDVPDLPEFADGLAAQFPTTLADRFPAALAAHPLRRQIVTTSLVNEMVNRAGITFAHRLAADVAATAEDAVRAFRVATQVFDLPGLWAQVAALPVAVPVAVIDGIALESRRLLDGAARWLLTQRPRPLAVGLEVDRFAPAVRVLQPRLPALLRGAEAAATAGRAADLVAAGVPAGAAERAAALAHAHGLLDVVEVAAQAADRQERLPIDEVARLWFALSERRSAPR